MQKAQELFIIFRPYENKCYAFVGIYQKSCVILNISLKENCYLYRDGETNLIEKGTLIMPEDGSVAVSE